MKPLTPDQMAVASSIAEIDRIIESLSRQKEYLSKLLPKARKADKGFIRHPITGERAVYGCQTKRGK